MPNHLTDLVYKFRQLFLLALVVCTSVVAHPPRHWRLLQETAQDLRGMLEDVDTGAEIEGARIWRVQEDILTISRRSEETQALVEFLFGDGKSEASQFVVDFQVVKLKAHSGDPKYQGLLRSASFSVLEDALGLSDKPGEARDFFLSRVQREVDRIESTRAPIKMITNADKKMRNGQRWLRHAAFTTMIVAGLGVGYLAYHGLSYVGLRGLPVERVAGAIGAGLSSTVYGFKVLWPHGEKPFTKLFLGGRYFRLNDSYGQLLILDVRGALPTVTEIAMQHGPAVTVQESAALDALISYQRLETTDALVELAVAHIEKGLVKRAHKMLDEIIRRETDGDLSRFAQGVKDALDAKQQFEKELAKLKRGYIRRSVLNSAAVLGVGLGTLGFVHPNAINLTRAFVLQGIGLDFLWTASGSHCVTSLG